MKRVCTWVFVALVGCSGSHGRHVDGGRDEPDFHACTVASECVVVPSSCCGSCGVATRGDATAVHRASVADHRSSVCVDGSGCPLCAGEADPTLIATCDAGRCVVVDLLSHPATVCLDFRDCELRAVDCCECGASITAHTVVAVSDRDAFEALVCAPGEGCPECAPVYPDTLRAACNSGRCIRTVTSLGDAP